MLATVGVPASSDLLSKRRGKRGSVVCCNEWTPLVLETMKTDGIMRLCMLKPQFTRTEPTCQSDNDTVVYQVVGNREIEVSL